MLNGKYARKIGLTIELSPPFRRAVIDYLRAFVPAGRLIFKYRHQVFLVRTRTSDVILSNNEIIDDLCRMWRNHVNNGLKLNSKSFISTKV